MKRLCGLLFGLFIFTIVALSSDLEEWNAYKMKYGKNYRIETEEKTRMEIFLNNKHEVEKHNKKHANGLVTFKMGLNKYSDLTPEEFSAQMKGFRPPSLLTIMNDEYEQTEYFVGSRHKTQHHLPESIDWREQGAVNGHKVQGSCGSCWAFSTTGAIEGQYFRKTGSLVQLSEQNLVDCVAGCGCGGCSETEGFQYVQKNGIDTADNYPYVEADGDCDPKDANITIRSYEVIPEGNEDKLTEAIATIGPISVSIDASHFSLRHYEGGIYFEPDCSSHTLDHGVLAIGYGIENGELYYIVKNWWGEEWGEHGYFRIVRKRCNHCGIATRAVYPIL